MIIKISLISILLLLLILPPALAQDFSIIEKKGEMLLQKKILTEKGVERLKSYASKNPNYTKNENFIVLEFLRIAFYAELFFRAKAGNNIEKKIKQEDEPLSFYWVLPSLHQEKDNKHLIHPQRSTIGSTRTRTLNDLSDVGLIGNLTFREAQLKLKDSTIVEEGGLVNYLLEREQYFSSYSSAKAKEIHLAEQLITLGLFEKEDVERLKTEYSEYELKGEQNILAYSKRCKIIDLRSLPANPDTIYYHVFEAVGKLIPTFQYSNLKVVLIESNEESELVEQQLQLIFEIKDQVYKHQFFHDIIRVKNFSEENPVQPPNKISVEFHKGINKFLREQNDSVRLHAIIFSDSRSVYGQEKIGIIVLNEAQADFLHTVTDSYTLSRESFDNRFSSKNVKNIIADFDSIGLFEKLSDEDKNTALKNIDLKDITNFSDLLVEFPNTLVIFDWETSNLKNPYEELTDRFAKASRGAFNPTNVKDDFERALKKNNPVDFEFTFGGKTYAKNLSMNGDWLDLKFMIMLENAMAENYVNGKFHFGYDNGQATGFFFLTNEQERFITTKYPDMIIKNEEE